MLNDSPGRIFLWALTPLAILMAVIYCTAYWNAFGVPFLEYISLTQVLTIAAGKLIGVVIFAVLLGFFSAVAQPTRILDMFDPAVETTGSKGAETIRWIVVGVGATLALVGLFVLAAFKNTVIREMFIAMGVAIIVSIVAARAGFLASIGNTRVRVSLLILMAMVPANAWVDGRRDAEAIRTGRLVTLLSHSAEVDRVLKGFESHQLRIIGHLDEWLFVLACIDDGPCHVRRSTTLRLSDTAIPVVAMRVSSVPRRPWEFWHDIEE